MGNAAIIEVAIGLIFIFSLISILVTQINTIIINLLNLKAKRLKEQLERMLTDPVIRARILTHPLIGMIETDNNDIVLTDPQSQLNEETAIALTQDRKAQVAYIDTKTFVDVLVDVLTARTGQKLYEELNKVVERMQPSVEKSLFRELIRQIQMQGTGLPDLRRMIDSLEDPETKRQMLAALNLVDAALDKLKVESSDLIPLKLGIRQIKDKYLETALEAVLNTAISLQDAQQKLGHWFDSNMGRATEVYVREMQRFSVVIGLVLALVLNVDTLYMGRILWEDPALRSSVAIAAAAAAPTLAEDIAEAESRDPTQPTGDLEGSIDEAQDTLRQLLDLRLPIGWAIEPVTPDATPANNEERNLWLFWPGNNPDWLGLWLRKIIGIAVTTIAVAQGAPFWFDLLKRLTGGRS